jgi:hypothetical protein
MYDRLSSRRIGPEQECIRLGSQFPAAALFDFARALGQPGEEGVNLLAYLATDLLVFAFSRIVLT